MSTQPQCDGVPRVQLAMVKDEHALAVRSEDQRRTGHDGGKDYVVQDNGITDREIDADAICDSDGKQAAHGSTGRNKS